MTVYFTIESPGQPSDEKNNKNQIRKLNLVEIRYIYIHKIYTGWPLTKVPLDTVSTVSLAVMLFSYEERGPGVVVSDWSQFSFALNEVVQVTENIWGISYLK